MKRIFCTIVLMSLLVAPALQDSALHAVGYVENYCNAYKQISSQVKA